MLKWRWTSGARNKCAGKDKADDRWRTAYNGSPLNRPDEIEKKHFIGQAGASQYHLPELRGRRREARTNSSGDVAETIGY